MSSFSGNPKRFEIIDVLRGFALCGILFINITAFYSPGGPPGLALEGDTFDRIIFFFLILFVESKFFTLFSFLFGIGFAIQLARARENERDNFIPRFTRRLIGLALFGIVHIVLLWEGDILLLYALAGLPLMLFRNASQRTLLKWILGLLAVPLLIFTALWTAAEAARLFPSGALWLQNADSALLEQFRESRLIDTQNLSGGTYFGILSERVMTYRQTFFLFLTRVPSVLAMFLLGFYVWNRGILQNISDNLFLLRRVRFWTLSLGLPTSLCVAYGYFFLPAVSALITLFLIKP